MVTIWGIETPAPWPGLTGIDSINLSTPRSPHNVLVLEARGRWNERSERAEGVQQYNKHQLSNERVSKYAPWVILPGVFFHNITQVPTPEATAVSSEQPRSSVTYTPQQLI